MGEQGVRTGCHEMGGVTGGGNQGTERERCRGIWGEWGDGRSGDRRMVTKWGE